MKLHAAAVVFLWSAIVAAQLAAPASYDWRRHTISQLAGHGHSNRWIMQAGLAGFGLLVLLGAVTRLARDPARKWADCALAVGGLSFLLTALFSTRPFQPGVPYSELEATVHAAFGTLARIATSAAMLLTGIVESHSPRKWVHFAFLSLVIVIYAMQELLTDGLGIVQRVLFIVGCAWLIFSEARAHARDRRANRTASAQQLAAADPASVRKMAT